MQLSSLFILSSVATLSTAMPYIPLVGRQGNVVTVYSDTGPVDVSLQSRAQLDSNIPRALNVALEAADVTLEIYTIIQGMVNDDIKRRQAFTKNAASEMRKRTGLNTVVCNVGYTIDSLDESIYHTDYNAKIGSDVTFDIITFTKGAFYRDGDGGLENWAYSISDTCQTNEVSIACN